jgi:hypothetical protein
MNHDVGCIPHTRLIAAASPADSLEGRWGIPMKHWRLILAATAAIVAVGGLLWWSGWLPELYPGQIRMELEGQPTRIFLRPLANLELVDGYLELQGFRNIRPDTEELVSLHLPAPREKQRCVLGASGSGAGWAGYFTRQVQVDRTTYYHTDEAHHGVVVITRLDRFLHIVEGTFAFDAFRKEDSSVLAVRRGRFTAMYRVVPAKVYLQPSRRD